MRKLLAALSPLGVARRTRDAMSAMRGDLKLAREAADAMVLRQVDLLYEQLRESPRHAEPKRLGRHEAQVFSQHGEDGVLAAILARVGAPTRTFVEVGVEDGRQCNTTYLLLRGWSGVWVEGVPRDAAAAREIFADRVADGRLRIATAFVTAENVSKVLRDQRTPEEPDVLSLDIDYNTYHLWDALRWMRPRVVVVEYNASIPATDDWVVPYHPAAVWDGSFYYGASLKAYERLGRELGYALVGCELSGTNAFFVRADLAADHFAEPFTAENHYEPPRPYLARKTWGFRRYWPGIDKKL